MHEVKVGAIHRHKRVNDDKWQAYPSGKGEFMPMWVDAHITDFVISLNRSRSSVDESALILHSFL